MIEVSNKFIKYSRDKNREVDAKVEISEEEEFVIFDKTEIIDFEIDNSITEGDDFSIGNVITSKLILNLFTDYKLEKNAVVKPYIRLDGIEGPSEWLQLGEFRIDNRKKQGNVWKFECYDELLKTQMLYKTNLQFPTTTKQILLEMLFNLDFEMDEEELVNLEEFEVTRRIDSYLYTYREVLSYIATIYAANIVMDNEGKLKFVYVDDRETKLKIEPSEYIGLNQLNEPKVFTKVVANVEGEREQLSIGDGDIDNTLFIENPIITEEMLENIYNKILNLTYIGVDVNKWRCFPYLEVGDFVTFKQQNGEEITTIIQTSKLKYKGGLSGKITSPSKSFMQSEYGFTGDTNKALSSMKDRIGVYVLAENNTIIRVDNRFQAKMMLPITSLDTTDIEFTIMLIGESSMDTILYAEIRSGEGKIGKTIKVSLKEGMNTVSVKFLIRAVPQFSDNLLLFIRVDNGRFVIEANEAQFYAYGANLVGDSGVPYAAIEDEIAFESFVIDDNTIIITTIPDKLNIVDIIEVNRYINSDTVEIFLEEVLQ